VAKGAGELKELIAALEAAGQADLVLEVMGDMAAADPADVETRANLAMAYVGRGDLEQAKRYLSAETAGTNPALWLTLAEMELRGNRFA
jgi:thioredoxin-like negative regulator of GroEL